MKRSAFPGVVAFLVLLFFYVPILLLAIQSFNASRFGGEWGGFSLAWYEALFEHRAIWHAARNTLIVALVSTLLAVLLGTLAGWTLHRYTGKLRQLHQGAIYAPLMVPDVLMGISLLLLFVNMKVQLGLTTIILAHTTFCVSYVALVVLGRLQDFDEHLIEAARDLGAGWGTIICRILLPLLGPGIAAGGLLAFTLSIDDFVITFFVSGPGSTTLPVQIYSMMRHGNPTLINALSVIFMTVTFSLVIFSQFLLRKR